MNNTEVLSLSYMIYTMNTFSSQRYKIHFSAKNKKFIIENIFREISLNVDRSHECSILSLLIISYNQECNNSGQKVGIINGGYVYDCD